MFRKKFYTLLAAVALIASAALTANATKTAYIQNTGSTSASSYIFHAWANANSTDYEMDFWGTVYLNNLPTVTVSGTTYYVVRFADKDNSTCKFMLNDGSSNTSEPEISDGYIYTLNGSTLSVTSSTLSIDDDDITLGDACSNIQLWGNADSWGQGYNLYMNSVDVYTYSWTEGSSNSWSGQNFQLRTYGNETTYYVQNNITYTLGSEAFSACDNTNNVMPTLTSGTNYTLTARFAEYYKGVGYNWGMNLTIAATSTTSTDTGDDNDDDDDDTTVDLDSDYNYYIVGDWNEVDGLWLPNPLGGLSDNDDGTYTATISDFYGEFKVIYVDDGRYDTGDATWYGLGDQSVTLDTSTTLSSSGANMYVGSSSTTTYSSLTFTLTVADSSVSLVVTQNSTSSSTEEDTSGTDTNYYLVTSFNDYTYKAYSDASNKKDSTEETTSTTSITYDISFASETAYNSFVENGATDGITIYVSGSSSYCMYLWYFDEDGNKVEPTGEWPGTKFSDLESATVDGKTYYYSTVEGYQPVYYIFNNVSDTSQTQDASVIASTYFSYSGGTTATTVSTDGSSSKVWAYAWMYAEDGEKSEPLGTWPGTNLSGLTSYSTSASVTLPTTTSLNFVVNNGHQKGTESGAVQTRDIVPGAYYGNYYVVITGTQETYRGTSANYQSYYTATSSGGSTQAAPSSGSVTIYLVPDEESNDATACPSLHLYTLDTSNNATEIVTSAKATGIVEVAGKYLWEYTVSDLTAPLCMDMNDGVTTNENYTNASAGTVDMTGIVADIYINFRAGEGSDGITDDSYHTLALNMDVSGEEEEGTALSESDYDGWKFKTIKISGGNNLTYEAVYFKAVIVQLNGTETDLAKIDNIECTDDDGLTMLIGYDDDFGDLASSEYFYVQQGNTGNRYGYQNGTVTYASEATDGSVTGFKDTDGWYEYLKGTYLTQLECDWTEKDSSADYMLFLIGTDYSDDTTILTTENGGRYVAVLLATETSIASGIEEVDSEGNVIVAETYYTIQGLQVQNPEDWQFYIVVRKYADGSVKAFKEAIR